MELLFSYGTLQNVLVQLETFGRVLEGYTDQLLDYQLHYIKIEDISVIELSGKTYHPIAVFSMGDCVDGVVFKITQIELFKSDQYEVDTYQRIKGKFQSGQDAWVYVEA
nr:gamma-glutamylcyclotransferase family protein [Candidatus Ruthturnera calyptogenae]